MFNTSQRPFRKPHFRRRRFQKSADDNTTHWSSALGITLYFLWICSAEILLIKTRHYNNIHLDKTWKRIFIATTYLLLRHCLIHKCGTLFSLVFLSGFLLESWYHLHSVSCLTLSIWILCPSFRSPRFKKYRIIDINPTFTLD